MSRHDTIAELLRRADINIKKGQGDRDAANAAWLVSYGASQQNMAMLLILEGLSERLTLIETALGLIAQNKPDR